MQTRVVMGVVISMAMSCAAALADTVELANGDLLSGKVTAVSGEQVLLTSEVLGDVKLPRGIVAAIHFGDRKPALAGNAAPAATGNKGVVVKAAVEAPGVDDVLKQLKAGAAGGDLSKMLTKEFPLLQSPEVKAYFDKTVGGLMSGELNVSDIRKQALDVREQVKELEKDLGPEGMAALKPYLSVLDKFIKDTEPRGGEVKAPVRQNPAADPPKQP
jgi:hypothetical protein